MGSLLLIGLFIGMRHALEADHVAAVASLMHNRQSLQHTLKQGSVWGLGHAITLFLCTCRRLSQILISLSVVCL